LLRLLSFVATAHRVAKLPKCEIIQKARTQA
jgi:hypothetical protein